MRPGAPSRTRVVLLFGLLLGLAAFSAGLVGVRALHSGSEQLRVLGQRVEALERERGSLPRAGIRHHKEELTVLSYASHKGSDDRFCQSVESFLQHGYRYHLIGWGTKLKSLNDKVYGSVVAVRELEDSAMVLFVDAYDVLVQAYPLELLERFRAFNRSLVVGAEKGCWPFVQFKPEEVKRRVPAALPDSADGRYVCDHYFPPSPTTQRYLNSGAWMGRAGKAKELFGLLQGRLRASQHGDDQEEFTYIYTGGKMKDSLALDFHSRLVKNMHASDDDWEVAASGRLRDKLHGTEPLLWHFNGGSKPQWPRIERALPYHQPHQRSSAQHFWSVQGRKMRRLRLGTVPSDFREHDGTGKIEWRTIVLDDLCGPYADQRRAALGVI
jgi:hypothetical protein